MPELADVQGFRRYVSRYASGRRIEGVTVFDAAILRNTSPQGLGRALKRTTFGHPERRGKWLLVPANGHVVVMHFGMTGALRWSRAPSPPERHDRVAFRLDRGELRYRAQRKLGGIWLARTEEDVAKITGALGPDALNIGRAEFGTRLQNRRGGIKSALMDQTRIAGLGNELSDEILWRARVPPSTPCARLGERGVDAVHRAMRDVLRDSVRRGRIPRASGWLTGVRGSDDPKCPRCGAAITRSKVGGRTAYWCPRCQRISRRGSA